MNTFFIVMSIVLAIEIPAVILYNTAKDAGLSLRELTRGRRLVGGCGVLVFGGLAGAVSPTLVAIALGYLDKFMHVGFVVPTMAPPATLLNLVALFVLARLCCADGVDASVSFIKRSTDPSNPVAVTIEGDTP